MTVIKTKHVFLLSCKPIAHDLTSAEHHRVQLRLKGNFTFFPKCVLKQHSFQCSSCNVHLPSKKGGVHMALSFLMTDLMLLGKDVISSAQIFVRNVLPFFTLKLKSFCSSAFSFIIHQRYWIQVRKCLAKSQLLVFTT